MEYLKNCNQFNHDFGIKENQTISEKNGLGKMFGVLIVKTSDGEIGYLAGYSGKIGERNDYSGFVPPIADLISPGSFYRIGEEKLNRINGKIEQLKNSSALCALKKQLAGLKAESENYLRNQRIILKTKKKEREIKRNNSKLKLTEKDYIKLCKDLKAESMSQQLNYKAHRINYLEQIQDLETQIIPFEEEILSLKAERKTFSARLQEQIFDCFNFLNIKGEKKNIREIFVQSNQKTPPSGAGECAAPKLLQYAFENNMTPITMAEFWWGRSPQSEIRIHGNFYPACRGKCGPILKHMLNGMMVDENPVIPLSVSDCTIEIIYEDDAIAVVNKPAGLLTVPGKDNHDSLYSIMKDRYPDANGPLTVHRLDMSTSGIVIIAKNKQAAISLQKQFMDRKIIKRYIAIIEGTIDDDNGIIKLSLRGDPLNRPYQIVCCDYGKISVTRYKKIETVNNQTRVELFPLTGRTHQLRVHLAHPQGLGCPIKGDELYGKPSDRLYLHADFVKFYHPESGNKISFSCPPEF
ncbi:MAG: RNA pseudouridine synthase [Spirochaetes bacterium]|nr:RNA pseudouridine synthase [Spirochaetota bacterium]MBN2772561.1 RNA pseudouridine synthase [Spirochaetota bacterium]